MDIWQHSSLCCSNAVQGARHYSFGEWKYAYIWESCRSNKVICNKHIYVRLSLIYIFLKYRALFIHKISCSFLPWVKGMNAAYDIIMVCNLNIYELAHQMLSRKKSADVSDSFTRCHFLDPNSLWIDLYFLFSTQIGGMVRSGLLMRLALLFLGGSFLLYARWRIMGTGPPSFTEVDNPASFAENVILRVSSPFHF